MAITFQATGVGGLKDALAGGHRSNKFELIFSYGYTPKGDATKDSGSGGGGFLGNLLSGLTSALGITSSNKGDDKEFSLLVKDINIPETSMTTAEIWYMGEKHYVPVNIDRTYQIDMTFYNDADLKHRYLLLEWMEKMNTTSIQETVDIEINPLRGGYGLMGSLGSLAESFIPSGGKDHAYQDSTHAIKLKGVYPMKVGGLDLSRESGNQLSTTTVTFVFAEVEYVKRESPLGILF